MKKAAGMRTCENPACDKTRAAIRERNRAYAAAWYVRNRAKIAERGAARRKRAALLRACEEKACKQCGKEYAPRTTWQRYCGPKCRAAAINPDAYKAYRAARHAVRRAKAIAYLGGCCVQCEATEELDFDHKDPATKKFSISRRLDGNWSILEPELRNCQLLCRSCHILKTEPESRFAAAMLRAAPHRGGSRGKAVARWQHGTYSGYKRHACRCAECKTASRAYDRDRYARNRDKIRARSQDLRADREAREAAEQAQP